MASVPIKVPSVGESISEGILARWLKPDGGSVQAGEPLFELETDKASSVVPAPSSGVLKIGVAEGETVADRRDRRHDRPGGNARGGCRRRRPPHLLRRRAAASGGDRRQAPASAGPAAADGGGNRPLSPAVRRAGRRGRGRRRPRRRHRARRPRHQGGRPGLPRSTRSPPRRRRPLRRRCTRLPRRSPAAGRLEPERPREKPASA